MCIRVGVYRTMQTQAPRDARSIAPVQWPFDEIAHHATEQQVGIVAGEKRVREKIHSIRDSTMQNLTA
jgi:hypothetical protein